MIKDNKRFLESNSETIRLSPVAYYLEEFDKSFFMNYHTHQYLEFMYCVSGSFTVSIFDNKNKIYKNIIINENEMIFLNTNNRHKLLMNNNQVATIGNVEFAVLNDNEIALERCINYSKFFIYYLKDLYQTPEGYAVVKDNYLIKKNLINLINYLEDSPDKNYLHQSMNILSFFYSIRESMTQAKEGVYSFVRQAIQYIYKNLNRQLSIEEIANHVNKSPSYFAHKFKEDRGVSVLKYINNARVDKARILLKDTALSINQIAKEVGFKNKDQLNYQFQAIINCTPSEYKKKIVYKTIDNRMITKNYHSIDFKGDN